MEREEGEREGRERGRYPQHRPTLLHSSGSRNGEGGGRERRERERYLLHKPTLLHCSNSRNGGGKERRERGGDTCCISRHSCTAVAVEMEREGGRGEREREIPAAQADTLALQ